MAKLFSSRLEPLSGWVLVRFAVTKHEIEVPIMEKGKIVGSRKQSTATSRATVLAVGPGEYSDNGTLMPPDPRLKPGVTILANGASFVQFSDIPEMKEEGIAYVPAFSIVSILHPEGMPATSKKPALVT